jgi:hypothetical protein
MTFDLYTILELCAIGGVACSLVGFFALMVGVHKARREFRSKGYLKPPSGTHWFRFLLFKQYDAFARPSTRFFFGISHFCLMAVIIVLMAVAILLGSEFLLKGMSGLPGGGFSGSSPELLPK